MPTTDRHATVKTSTPAAWINWHQNIVQPVNRLYDVWNATPPGDALADLRLTTTALKGLIAEALRDNTTLRCVGGGWSLSTAAVTDGRLVNTKPLNMNFGLSAKSVSPAYKGPAGQLYFAQCGTSVQELNESLIIDGRALRTSGASNGQTIVGAVSTGTHGAAFGYGAMQEYVVGLHLIVGADRDIWLERATYPVVSDDFVARLGAELVRDDALFNAAVVSFGSFGIVHAVMLESDPVYLLEAARQRLPINDALRHAMQTLDVSALALPHPTEKPWHFEVVVNPHDVAGGAYVTSMYKRPYRPDYPKPGASGGAMGPGDDLLGVVGKLTELLPSGIVADIANLLVKQVYPVMPARFGTHAEIFGSTTTRGKVMSMELGVPIARVPAVLDLLLGLHPEVGSYAGFLAFRFVKGSKATMAFTQYDITCTVEFPAAYSASTQKFYDRAWKALDKAEIPYTLHWGQMNNFTPQRVRAMYGARVDAWVGARRKLLKADVRRVFNNTLVDATGLGG